jgi:exopolysaccharide production protein ExoQ
VNESRAPAAVATAAERTTAPHDTEEALGWDEIAAIGILLMAAVGVHDRLPDLSILVFVPRVLWLLMYVAAAARLVQRFRAEWLIWEIRRQPALCVLLALAAVSSVWSLAPAITLQRSISLLGTTVLGMFIGHACPPQRLMRVLFWTFVVLMVTSVAAALVFPAPVGDGVPVGWRGIMMHKNSFGAAAVLATSFFVVLTLGRLIHPLWGVALCVLCMIGLVETRSRTSFVALTVCLAAGAYLVIASAARRPTSAQVRRLSLGLVLAVSIGPFFVGPLASIFGNDDPLNGRTRIWDGAMTIFTERPLTGYGYAVVWGRSDATLLPHIAITAHRSAASAHNSIIHVGTELGIPAAIVAGVCLFGALSNAGRLFERVPSAFSLFALVFLIGFVLLGFTEAQLLQIHSVFWILFVGITVAVTRALKRCGDGAPAAGARRIIG